MLRNNTAKRLRNALTEAKTQALADTIPPYLKLPGIITSIISATALIYLLA